MYTLSEERFQAEAAPALHQVFVREDPYDQPFAPGVEERRLLYPVDLILSDMAVPLLDAVVSAAQEVGDTGFYLSVLGRIVPATPDMPYHWYFRFSEVNEYQSLGYISSLEHALYSPSGRWGIMTSYEDHLLLGCSSVFLNAMHKVIPGFDDIKQIQDFLSIWEYYATKFGGDVSWIPGLLTQVYGAQTAQRLLAEASFTDLL